MKLRVGTAVAVGAAVIAEVVLGVLLVARGGGSPVIVNPWRVGDGFPQPPPCSMIDRVWVERLTGAGAWLEEESYREDDDPTRRCTFGAADQQRGAVQVTMRSHVYGNGPLEIHSDGLSELRVSDNLTTSEVKRYDDYINIQFDVDNLGVLISYSARVRQPGKPLPEPSDAERVRADAHALAKEIAGKLTPRNKEIPSRTR